VGNQTFRSGEGPIQARPRTGRARGRRESQA
jgi:hypothetical protein